MGGYKTISKANCKKLEKAYSHMVINLPESWQNEDWFKDVKKIVESLRKQQVKNPPTGNSYPL